MAGFTLALLAFSADAAAVAATHSGASSPAVYGLLALAWALSVAAYLSLRSHGGGGGEPPMPADPDPPWWPEFERQFHDYSRRGPRPRARQPIA